MVTVMSPTERNSTGRRMKNTNNNFGSSDKSSSRADLNEDTLLNVDGDRVKLLRKSPKTSPAFERRPSKDVAAAAAESGSDVEQHDLSFLDSKASSSSFSFWHDLRGDRSNLFLLIFLYILQGIPLGLAGSVSFILGSRHATYHEQAQFSLVFWPFSLKLLWAPLVDYVYSRRFGRRKSWLVPTQYLIGLFMVVLARYTDSLVERPTAAATVIESDQHAMPVAELKPPPLLLLTLIFFMLNFLASVQDIAVDGWALTMLKRKNVGYASTANSVGQTAGYFIGNILFLALESPDFCNKFLRATPKPLGIVTLSSFLSFFGIVFLVTTTLVAVFKREREEDADFSTTTGSRKKRNAETAVHSQSLIHSYRCLIDIMRLPSVQQLAIVMLTAKVAFAASESVGALKLIEFGVQKEQLAFLGSLMVPLQIVLPILISKRTNGARPLDVYLQSYPYRVAVGLLFAVLVYFTPSFKQADGSFSTLYYMLILINYFLHQITVYCMFVASMAFSNRVSDPSVGGTYMTLLNTLSNLGGVWPSTLFLAMTDTLSWKKCRYLRGGGDDVVVDDEYKPIAHDVESCNDKADAAACGRSGGTCVTAVDGFYVEVVVCCVLAALWLWKVRPIVQRVSALPERAWKLTGR